MARRRGRSHLAIDDREFNAALQAAIVKAKIQSADELAELAHNVINKAQRYVPVDKGRLRNSIGIKQRGVDTQGPFIVLGTRVKYAKWVEYGTGIHGPLKRPITPKTKKALAFKVNGQTVITKSVKGMKPQPFMRPALLEAAVQWRPRRRFFG